MQKAVFNTKTRFIAIFCILTLASSILLGGCGADLPAQPQINDTTAAEPTGTPPESNADAPAAEGRMEGPGFASGEDALLYALSAIQKCDLEALVSCYTVETFLERFDFEDYYVYDAFHMYLTSFWPADGGFGTEMNRYAREAEVLRNAALPFIGAVNGCFADGLEKGWEHYTDLIITSNNKQYGEVDYDAYLAALKGGEAERVFGTLRVTGGVFNVTEAYLAQVKERSGQEWYERYLSQFELYAKAYGADQWVSFGIPVNVGGLDCYFGVTALNYGKRWYLQRVGSSLETAIGGFSLSLPGAETAEGLPAPALPDVSSAGTLAARRYEGPGFSSPEEAAKAYVETIIALDPDAAVACYAVDRLVDGDLLADRTTRLSENPMGGGTFLASAARIALAEDCAAQLGRNYLCLLDMVTYDEQGKHWYETIDGVEPPYINTNRTEKYPYARAQLYDLLSNRVIRVKLSQADFTSMSLETTRNDGTRERAAKLGASDFAMVTLTRNGLTIYVHTVCFDGRWYVFPMFIKSVSGNDSQEWALYG